VPDRRAQPAGCRCLEATGHAGPAIVLSGRRPHAAQ